MARSRSPLGRRVLLPLILVIALALGVFGTSLPAMADTSPGVPHVVGQCVFTPLDAPQLSATYGPALIQIVGAGTCVTNLGKGTISISLGGSFGPPCGGGLGTLSGAVFFSNGIDLDQSALLANIVSADSLVLTLQNVDLSWIGEANLAFESGYAGCPQNKSFTTLLSGTMDFTDSF